MSASTKRVKRVDHYKQPIDWLLLFEQVQNRRACTDVAAEHPGVSARTLQERYRAWCEAKRAGDAFAVAKWEGKVNGRRYSHSALSQADEAEVASRLRAAKREGEYVSRAEVVQAVMELWAERHPRPTRSLAPFKCSPQFITRFRRRHGFSTKKHKLRRQGPAQREDDDSKADAMAEYLIHVDEAVEQYGANNVINADETAAHGVQHTGRSWGIVGEPNVVNTGLSERDAITTMPAVSAAGDRLPMQVLVKGKTQRAVKNKNLPHTTAAYPTGSGWQTSSSITQYIEDEVSQYTDDQPSALIMDDYDAHKTEEVRGAAERHNTDLIIVPPGMTSTLQPLDVGVNGELKRRAREKWVQDKAAGKENADTLSRAAQRMNEAYHELPASTFTNAFNKAVPSLAFAR
jgi:hypothetical protein